MTKEATQFKRLSEAIIKVFGSLDPLFDCQLMAVLWRCDVAGDDGNGTVHIDITNRDRLNAVIKHLNDGYELDHLLNNIGSLDIEELILSVMTQIAVPIMLSLEQLTVLFYPLKVDRFLVKTDFPFAYTGIFDRHLSAVDTYILETTIGIEIVREFKWLHINDDGSESGGFGFDFIVSNLAAMK